MLCLCKTDLENGKIRASLVREKIMDRVIGSHKPIKGNRGTRNGKEK